MSPLVRQPSPASAGFASSCFNSHWPVPWSTRFGTPGSRTRWSPSLRWSRRQKWIFRRWQYVRKVLPRVYSSFHVLYSDKPMSKWLNHSYNVAVYFSLHTRLPAKLSHPGLDAAGQLHRNPQTLLPWGPCAWLLSHVPLQGCHGGRVLSRSGIPVSATLRPRRGFQALPWWPMARGNPWDQEILGLHNEWFVRDRRVQRDSQATIETGN